MTTKAEMLQAAEDAGVALDVDMSNTKEEIEEALDAAGVDLNVESEPEEEASGFPPEVGDAERAEAQANVRNREAEARNAEAWKEREAELLEQDAQRVAAAGDDALDAAIAQKQSELDALTAQKG